MQTFKKIAFVLIGVVVSFYLYSVLYELIDNNSYAINQYGREILARYNQIWIFIVSMSLFHIVQILIAYIFYRTKKLRFIGIGFFISVILLVVYRGVITYSNSDKQERISKFNQKEWMRFDEKPIEMVRNIYLNWGHCHSKKEIVKLLGVPDYPDGIGMFYENYNLNTANNIYYLTNIKSNGYKCYLEFVFASKNSYSQLKDCNSINIVTFGDNNQFSINTYIELY